jgi:hypothetical protein
MILALIAALVVTVCLLAFALLTIEIMSRALKILAVENAGLRSAVEYRDEIIESRLGEIDVTCECDSCREAERWLVN